MDPQQMAVMVQKAEILMEALPYIRAFSGKTIVIKYGGAAMESPPLKESFALDVILLKFVGMNPVIVHGGGPQIGAMMKRLGKEPKFLNGMRITDEETMEIVEMVLVGRINKEIVGLINSRGGKAVGLSGKDGNLILARRLTHKGKDGDEVDLGLVGEVEAVNPQVITLLEENGFIPVIAPIGVGAQGESYNINADLVAGELAAALSAEKLIHLTDVGGVKGVGGRFLSSLTKQDALKQIDSGQIEGGMLPKVESALRALEGGTKKAHIIDGRIPHAILLELFTKEGIGTEIVL
jgi:acetylglutamate kinase